MFSWIEILFDRKSYRNPLTKPQWRNKSCPCGSGYKVKSCCGVKYSISRREWERIRKFWNKGKKGNGNTN